MAGSRFDSATATLVGEDLAPGYYTGFGFSALAGENLLQRLLFDAQRGFRLGNAPLESPAQVTSRIATVPGEERPRILGEWLQARLIVPFTMCFMPLPTSTLNCAALPACSSLPAPQCPPGCDPECCRCGTFGERLYLPIGIFRIPLEPCVPGAGGRFCPICPHGLNCPARADSLRILQPRDLAIDPEILRRMGFTDGPQTLVVREALHGLAQQTLRIQIPRPPGI